eukprot:CAMPEP_0174252218 /NCGR_PEP_ID=MMETSP0439-20130205/1787_1 /TAXON_ID=0 /ORGANISM="Stereomyxa ramosa, Strain Chinc5" /LENGTH=276 /DNA_ID=CAMNT_0015332727 /DNA_START=47 /DNA_END=877 /DNA_ORIENTATION=+
MNEDYGGWGGGGTQKSSHRSYQGGRDPLIETLTANVRKINQNNSEITRMVHYIGVPGKDSQELRQHLREIIEATRDLAVNTNRTFQTIGVWEDKRLQVKLKNDFQSALQRFSDISKQASKKESSCAPPPRRQTFVPPPETEYDSEEEERQGLLAEQKRQQLLQLETEREFQNYIDREREEGIKSIETSIAEVNEIFIDLAALVQEQQPMVDSIEAHIDNSVAATHKGVEELRKAAEHQKSARTKTCCILVVILILIVTVIIILILSTVLGFKLGGH